MQNVSDAAPDANVQHLLFVASVQSALTLHSCTFVVSVQLFARCVGHAAEVVHDVPSEATPHCGKLPVPSGTSTPQHTGVEPPHVPGPSQLIRSGIGQLAIATQPNVVVAPGIVQHTSSVVHAEPVAHANG